jgi:hypothetical protein
VCRPVVDHFDCEWVFDPNSRDRGQSRHEVASQGAADEPLTEGSEHEKDQVEAAAVRALPERRC